MNLFESIAAEAAKRNLKSVVIGGMAVIEHGYARTTTDVDILVRATDKDAWDGLFESLGYRLHHDGGSFRQYLPLEGTSWPVDLMLVNDASFQPMVAAAKSVVLEGVPMQLVSLEHYWLSNCTRSSTHVYSVFSRILTTLFTW